MTSFSKALCMRSVSFLNFSRIWSTVLLSRSGLMCKTGFSCLFSSSFLGSSGFFTPKLLVDWGLGTSKAFFFSSCGGAVDAWGLVSVNCLSNKFDLDGSGYLGAAGFCSTLAGPGAGVGVIGLLKLFPLGFAYSCPSGLGPEEGYEKRPGLEDAGADSFACFFSSGFG